jgi:isoleucyl-tRNA synthetase
VDLSSFYFDIRKDALYCDSKDSDRRKSSIIVLNIILESLVKWFAPILSFTTEEIFTLINKEQKSIHLEQFIKFPESFKDDELHKKWTKLKKIRDICNISIEAKRAGKEIGSSLEAEIIIYLNKELLDITKDVDFSELCITSKAEIKYENKNDIIVTAKKALGYKCPVCWKISISPCIRHPK